MSNEFKDLSPEARAALTAHAHADGRPLTSRWAEAQPSFGGHRSAAAAACVAAAGSVADLGCGSMELEGLLSSEQAYIPVDLVRRDDRTIILDLNVQADLARLPDAAACVLLGVLEYAYEPRALLTAVSGRYAQAVVTFNVRRDDEPVEPRLSHGWVNHYTLAELGDLFAACGLDVATHRRLEGVREEYLFTLQRAASPASQSPI